MRPGHLLIALALFGCQKEDRSVRYEAKCDRCTIWYNPDIAPDVAVDIAGYWSYSSDTTINGPDTTIVVDSVRVLGSWSIDLTMEHDERPSIRAYNLCGSSVTSISITENSVRSSRSTSTCNDIIAIN